MESKSVVVFPPEGMDESIDIQLSDKHETCVDNGYEFDVYHVLNDIDYCGRKVTQVAILKKEIPDSKFYSSFPRVTPQSLPISPQLYYRVILFFSGQERINEKPWFASAEDFK